MKIALVLSCALVASASFVDVAFQKATAAIGNPLHASTVWEWLDCGSPTDVIEVKSLQVNPDPPKPGNKLTVTASGTVKSLVDEGAYADVVVKLGLIKLLTRRFDICEELRNANATLQCPIKPGDYEITQSVDLPREIPRAKFNVVANAFTQDDQDMVCAQIVIECVCPDVAGPLPDGPPSFLRPDPPH